jgi:hypothetical protein
MQVFAFIDTNVLLHYQFFRDVNWAQELRADDVTLVFAPVVVEELDKRKWAGSRRERERAKKVLKTLRELGLSATRAPMRPGVGVLALDEEPADALFLRHRLQPRVSDDRLLASALAFHEARETDARVLILTADTGLSIKAPTRQIDVAAPGERLESGDEPDDTERELEAAKRELAALRAVAPSLRLTVAGEVVLKHEVRRFGEFSAGELGRLLEAWRSRHPRVAATPDSIVMPGGGRFSLAGLSGFPGFWSEKDAAEYNAEVDRVYGKYEDFLRRWPAALNALTRCVEFRFVLENAGTAPADDVDLLISADAKGKWIEELPDLPAPPELPKPRNPYDLDILAHMPHFDPADIRLRDSPIDGPNILEEDPRSVQYAVKRVKHHVPCELPVVYFQFDSDEDVGSFTVSYRLVAANIREAKKNDLHAKLSVSALVGSPSPEELFKRSARRQDAGDQDESED